MSLEEKAKGMKEQIEQYSYSIGYDAADELLTVLSDISDECKAIAIKGFIEGFKSWEIDEIEIVEKQKEL